MPVKKIKPVREPNCCELTRCDIIYHCSTRFCQTWKDYQEDPDEWCSRFYEAQEVEKYKKEIENDISTRNQ